MLLRAGVGLAALVLAVSAQAQHASVELKAEAESRAARYTLGDVADVRSDDARLARSLAATEIGLAPRVGYSQSVPRQAIAQRIDNVHPQLRGRLQWQGADAVVVRGGGERLDAPSLQRVAERTLVDALEQRGLRAEVRALEQQPGELRLPAGATRLTPRLAEGWTPAPRMRVWVDVGIDGRGYRSVPLWFAVKAEQEAYVARSDLRAGTRLRADDLRVERVDVAKLASAPLAADAQLDGLRLRRAVAAGSALLASAVESRPAVLRNQAVDVQVAIGAVRLRTAGIALRDGRLGETVNVMNPANRERFGALVVADGTVRVEAR